MFSPTVSEPLTCSPGRLRGSNASYCSISALRLHLEGGPVVGGPPVVEVAVAVVLRALVVEAVTDLVADDRADAAVVLGRVGVGVEERLLQDAGGEADLVGAGVVVGVDGLRQHEPLVAVDGRADLRRAGGRSRTPTPPRRCPSGRLRGRPARSSRGTRRGSRSWAGRCRACRRPAAWSPRSSSRGRRSSAGTPRAGWSTRSSISSLLTRREVPGDVLLADRLADRRPRRSRRRASSGRAARACR